MRVAIIGGGVIGLACAYYLRRDGAEVSIIERDRTGSGCSAGNGGWICPSISTPLPSPDLTLRSLGRLLRADSALYIKPSALPALARWLAAFRRHCSATFYEAGVEALGSLNERTLELYRELVAEGVEFEWAARGMLLAQADEASKREAIRALRRLEGFGVGPVRPLDRDELRELEPALAGELTGGVLVESDAHVRPESLCAALAARLDADGVERIEGCEVSRFVTELGRVQAAVGSSGEVRADTFVIAAGAESGRMAGWLGRPLPVQAGKGYSITVEEPTASLRHPVHVTPAKMGFTPFEGSIRTLGTLELSGINRRLDRRRIANLERAAARYLPGALDGRSRADWVGMRPVTPDGLPAIGRLAETKNAFMATGHQMLGVTLAPATGRALADLILTGRSESDLSPFDPGRFSP